MTADPPPRRKWHLSRWLLVFAFLAMAWSGWRAYTFRSALSQAKALGWTVEYTDPVETIRKNWNAAFKKETWLDGVTGMHIPTGEAFELHLAIVQRLDPKALGIFNAATLRDLSAFNPLTRLQHVYLIGCSGLIDVAALKNLPALRGVSLNNCGRLKNLDGLKDHPFLQEVWVIDCTALTNVDGLKNLPALHLVKLINCTGLTNVDALKNIPSLDVLNLEGCTGLTNLDALTDLPALRTIWLDGCKGLANVDALKSLRTVKWVTLEGCTGLSPESIAALKAALPDAEIYGQ